MEHLTTLNDALVAAAATAGGYTFLDGDAPDELPFAGLAEQARAYAGALQHLGVAKGDRVLVALPTGAAFARVFFGLLLCGATPCVLPPPAPEGLGHMRAVADRIGARLLVTTAPAAAQLALAGLQLRVCADADLAGAAHPFAPVAVAPGDLAIVQASSGTTGAPKCVGLTHANLLANIAQIGERLGGSRDDVVVSWLPLYHDMGLIGCFLYTLCWELRGVFMSPQRFIRHPATWLRAISAYGGTLSPAPNFAYALAARRLADRDLEGLDLATWRAAMCGAELIDVAALAAFAERFAPYGLRAGSLVPCYGLAEASLCVTMQDPGAGMAFERVARATLAADGVAVPLSARSPEGATLVVDCGRPVAGMAVEVRDEAGRPLSEGHVGAIWISGPSVTGGYLGAPELTAATISGGWLGTGDLGYMRGGRLFVTGRRKDLIIIRGHNYQPAEFEAAAAEVPGVAPGRVVAVGVYSPHEATERLVILAEQPREAGLDEQALRDAIRLRVGLRTGVLPAEVLIVPRHGLPKTTSGKLQRARARQLFLEQAPREAAA
ncbi:MAG TPA: AMP-binding protein [Chloroflexaceae bacterium]|mgnify:CR=1 FL=1|nr:AMP-binding protein [Chloroflexaceae bacterium]